MYTPSTAVISVPFTVTFPITYPASGVTVTVISSLWFPLSLLTPTVPFLIPSAIDTVCVFLTNLSKDISFIAFSKLLLKSVICLAAAILASKASHDSVVYISLSNFFISASRLSKAV